MLELKTGPWRLLHGLHIQDEPVLGEDGKPVTFEVTKIDAVASTIESTDGRTFRVTGEGVHVRLNGKQLSAYVGGVKTAACDLRLGDTVALAEEVAYGADEIQPKLRKPNVIYGKPFMSNVELDAKFNNGGGPFTKYVKVPNPAGQLAEAKRRVAELEAQLVEKKPASVKK